MYDVPDTTSRRSVYECLGCGTIVRKQHHPGNCSDCGGMFQNRAMSLE